MYIKKISILFITLILFLCNSYSQTLSLRVTDNEIGIGEETSIEVKVENISDLKGYSLIITYKSNVVKCSNIARGDFLSSAAQTIFLSDIDSLSQEITIEEVILTNASKSGGGQLASFKLTGLNDGIVNLSFIESDFRDSDNRQILLTSGTTTIVVGDTSSINDERLVLTPRLSQIREGNFVKIYLQVENVENLNNYTTSIFYDGVFLKPIEIVEKDFLSNSGSTTFEFSIDSAEGKIDITSSLAEGIGATGTGYLASIKLEAIQEGSTALVLGSATAQNSSRMIIDNIELLNAVINILPIFNQTDSLKVNPVSRSIDQKDTTAVIIEITNVELLKSYSIYLNYNPTILRALRIERLDFLSTDNETFFFSKIDSISGRIKIDESILGAGSKEGTGDLFKIYFYGENPGVSNIDFDSVLVMDDLQEKIELDLVNSSIDVEGIVGIDSEKTKKIDFRISQNYPNPFNAGTTIKYTLAANSDVDINIYNIMGQKIIGATIINTYAGEHYYYWDGKDYQNRECSSGMYLLTISNGSLNKSIKLLLLK